MKPYDDGEVRRQYWCQPRPTTPDDTGCGRISVDQRELDRHVGALVVAILGDPRHAAAVESATRATADARRTIEAEVVDIETLAEQLADRLGRGEITLSRYDAATAPLDCRLTELRHRLDELAAMPEADVPPEVVAASAPSGATLGIGHRGRAAHAAPAGASGSSPGGQPGRPDSAEEVRPDSGRRRLTRYD